MRYWGPALIAVGVIIAGAALVAWNAHLVAMLWALSMAALVLIAGVSLTVASRQSPTK